MFVRRWAEIVFLSAFFQSVSLAALLVVRPKKIVCFRSPDRLTLFSPTDSVFFKKNEVNQTTNFERSFEVLKDKICLKSVRKWIILLFLKRNLSRDNTKILQTK